MNIAETIQAINDSTKEGQFQGYTPERVIDSLLYSGTLTIGNQNDYANMFNRVGSNLTEENRNRIIENLESKFSQDEKVSYRLSTDSDDEFVYKVQIGKLTLTFNNLI